MLCSVLLALLLCAAPAFDTFDGPLDPARWYIGVPKAPKRGVLRIPKQGWIVSRNIPDDGVSRIEVFFTSRGGVLELGFFSAKEPLSSPVGDSIVVKKGRGARARVLVVTKEGATLDGEALAWKGALRGTFRLRALKGAIDLDAVHVAPRRKDAPELGYIEKRTVNFSTTPEIYQDYRRVTLLLWDVEVCFLLRYKLRHAFSLLAAPPRGCPTLTALATLSTGKDLALLSGSADWRDERRNLSRKEFFRYLKDEYKLFEIMQIAQRAMNAAVPGRKDLGPLVQLAVIRHTKNTDAAVELAYRQNANVAIAALKKALGGLDVRRAPSDKLRAAAGAAARAILKEPPAQWPGFQFDPKNRFVTIEHGKELSRG